MSISLKPIGCYAYDPDEYTVDEAWKQLEHAKENGTFVICKATAFSETDPYLELDYHNIRGRIELGQITQNRYLSGSYFVDKTFCVQIRRLNRTERSFTATRLPVEQTAAECLRTMAPEDPIGGVITFIKPEGTFAFVDVMEGIQFHLASNDILRRPTGCSSVTEKYQLGDLVQGYVLRIEPPESRKSALGRMSCLDMSQYWLSSIGDLKRDSIIEGNPRRVFTDASSYYIPLSDYAYIRFSCGDNLPADTPVSVRITDIDPERYRINGVLVTNSSVPVPVPLPESALPMEPIVSIFDKETKATVSPYKMRQQEAVIQVSRAPGSATMDRVWEHRQCGRLTDLHIEILKIINKMVFSTGIQIWEYLFTDGKLPPRLTRDKLRNRLEYMITLGLIRSFRFKSDEGDGIYRVYCVDRNGDRVLRTMLRRSRTTFNQAVMMTPPEQIKRQLATNQIILAYKGKFDFFQDYRIQETLPSCIDADIPVRPSGRILCANCNLLLETRRRFKEEEEEKEKEDFIRKVNRYAILMKNHAANALPRESDRAENSENRLNGKALYLLFVCEDEKHATEIRNLFYGHELYPQIFFTYDLLLFKNDINHSIFRFTGDGNTITFYDVAELLNYGKQKPVTDDDSTEKQPEDEVVDGFMQCLKLSPSMALNYLNDHDSPSLREYVSGELTALFSNNADGSFSYAYPEEEQYYVYLLYAISHDLFKGVEEIPDKSTDPLNPIEPERNDVEEDTPSSAYDTPPEVLEGAVNRVVDRLCELMDLKTITNPSTQTSGTQHGYDVGITFSAARTQYQLAFECKSYQTLRKKNDEGKNSPLTVEKYAYNLLQYYMHCPRKAANDLDRCRNYWILVSPYADLQNDFLYKLFDLWNGENQQMSLKAFTRIQTSITCEEFLSLDPEAFKSVYQREAPAYSPEERKSLAERIYNYLVGEKTVQKDIYLELEQYPFDSDCMQRADSLMTLRTADGEDVHALILKTLYNNQSVFLTGEYGSGKTYMTYQIVRTILMSPDTYGFYPLWFQLVDRELEPTDSGGRTRFRAEEFLKKGEEKHGNFSYRSRTDLGTRKYLMILDGLDEIVSGLGNSTTKRDILMKIIHAAKHRYGKDVLFLISSREMDFKSCFNDFRSNEVLGKFARIAIGDCQPEDAIQKLKIVEADLDPESGDQAPRLTSNPNLMLIARKPLYYGFLYDIIQERGYGGPLDSEVDILRTVINRSVKRYREQSSDSTNEHIYDRLCDIAIDISQQLTNGGEAELVCADYLLSTIPLKNVLRVRQGMHRRYIVQFYHNAIREYLVAEKLYRCIEAYDKQSADRTKVMDILCEIELTPEMMDFFCQLVMKDYPGERSRWGIVDTLESILKTATSPNLGRMGANLFALTSRLEPNGQRRWQLDLPGIYADNLYLWQCTLNKINLQNAHFSNMHLFDVKLDHVDLREADLTGLVIGQDADVIQAHHRVQGSGMSIFCVYENHQLAEYRFDNSSDLSDYRFVLHSQLPAQKFRGLCAIRDDVIVYSDRQILFENYPDRSWELPEHCRLITLTSNTAVVEKKGSRELTFYKRNLNEAISRRLTSAQSQHLCILGRDIFLHVCDQRLRFMQENQVRDIVNLNSTFECFTAHLSADEATLHIFIKYMDSIQQIRYNMKSGNSTHDFRKLPEHAIYQQITAIHETLVYAVSGSAVHLLDLSQENLQPVKLQIKVICQDLILMEPDGTRRIQDDAAYELLRELINDTP